MLLPGGPARCRKNRRRDGRRGGELKIAANEGVDTFVTGEGPHWTHALAEEAGLNVFYGGHYATETFGVKALAAELSKKFRRAVDISGPSIRIIVMPLPYKIATLLYCFNQKDEALLLRRKHKPNLGLWSPCGGKLHMAAKANPPTPAPAARPGRKLD